MKWLAIASLAVASAVGVLGVSDYFRVPFSDAQIQSSFVDTWQPAALVTSASLVLLGVIAVLCLALAFWTTKASVRLLAIAAIAVTVASGALSIYNHAELTERTTRLTGHTFGGFFGLF